MALHAQAWQLARHGQILNSAFFASQCLDRRIADKQILAHEVTAWQDHRNKHHAKADWQFTTANARVKLKRLYPQFERDFCATNLQLKYTNQDGRARLQICQPSLQKYQQRRHTWEDCKRATDHHSTSQVDDLPNLWSGVR